MNYKIYTAIITPFLNDNSIDYIAVKRIIENQIKQGVDGVVVCGTTGEASTLESKEKLELMRNVVMFVDGRIKVIAGVGSNNTSETLELIALADQIEGIDEYLVVVPYYSKPSQTGLYQHFKEIAGATKRNIMVYNVPKRAGIEIEEETLDLLINECSNITSLKHASHNLELVRNIKQKHPEFEIYSGEDNYLLEGLEAGMNGVVSVCSHIIANEIRDLLERYEFNDNIEILDDYVKLCAKYVFIESSPSPTKYLMHKLGYCHNILRLPLVPVSIQNERKLDQLLKRVKKA